MSAANELERVEALEAKCALLSASLAQADTRCDALLAACANAEQAIQQMDVRSLPSAAVYAMEQVLADLRAARGGK